MRLNRLLTVAAAAAWLLAAMACQSPPPAPDKASDAVPLTPDGVVDVGGIWQALGTAHWNLEAHAASEGPVPALGALGAIPAGLGVVVGGTIPYQPWATEERDANAADWVARDPAVKCFMPGIPRAAYMPFPFQIVQGKDSIFVAYEFTSSTRIIHLDRPGTEAPLPSWMGYSLGHYEGASLVVDVTAQVPDTWFDSAGNFHSDELRVTERYTRVGPNLMQYEATIDDPKVFTEPWSIAMPLYRRQEEGARLLEFKCVEFAEEAVYGHLYATDEDEAGDG